MSCRKYLSSLAVAQITFTQTETVEEHENDFEVAGGQRDSRLNGGSH